MADFSLKAVFGLDATGVRTELRQLSRETRSFANSFGKTVIAAAIAAFAGLSKGVLDLASSLKDSAGAVGIGIEQLQALTFVASQNGASQEEMAKALEKTRVFMQKATEGGAEQLDILRKLGLSADRLTAMPLEQKFEALAKAYAGANDKGAAYNAVSEIFGQRIGPKMVATLNDLAAVGFPGAADAARKAGAVMSNETVMALDRAQQAIEDFKKRATIAVGEILVNFRTKEGMELLWYELRAVGEKFVARIADAVVEAGGMFRATFEALGVYARERVQNGLVSAAIALGEALNKVLPERFQINIGNLDQFRVASEDFKDILARTISTTKPSGFTEAVEQSWNKIIEDQRTVVKALNEKDFAKEGRAMAESIDNAGTSLAAKVDAALNNFFGSMDRRTKGGAGGGAGSGGGGGGGGPGDPGARPIPPPPAERDYLGDYLGSFFSAKPDFSYMTSASDAALQEIVKRNKAKMAGILGAPASGLDVVTGHLGAKMEAFQYDLERAAAQRELDLRNQVRRAYSSTGTQGVFNALPNVSPAVLDRMINEFAKQRDVATKTQQTLDEINMRLKPVFKIGG